MVGLSVAACGTEDDAAPAPGPSAGTGATAGDGEVGGTAGKGGTGAEPGIGGEGGTGGNEPGPGPGGSGGDAAGGQAGAGGDGPGSGGDANDAGSGGEGGQAAPLPCHTVLFNFNTNPGGGIGTYLTPNTGPVQSSTVEWSSTEGVAALGAAKLNATFGALDEQAQLSVYTPAGTWACTTKLHAMIKLQSATDLSTLSGLNFSINSGPYDDTGRYAAQFTSTANFALDTWYAIELPFATAGFQKPPNTLPLFSDVRSIGFQLHTQKTGATPTPVTLYVDDVWVE